MNIIALIIALVIGYIAGFATAANLYETGAS